MERLLSVIFDDLGHFHGMMCLAVIKVIFIFCLDVASRKPPLKLLIVFEELSEDSGLMR